MRLKLTDTEFAILSDMVYAGNWVINDCRLPGSIIAPYKEMLNKLLAIYEARYRIPEIHACDINAFFDARLQHYFDYFSEHTMNCTLAKKYAQQFYPGDTKEASEAQDKYLEELTANDLKNVEIKIE